MQQIISQYADDTSYSLHGEKENFRQLILLLTQFRVASGLVINWHKSVAYWFSDKEPPDWTVEFDCQWAQSKNLSKILGSPFGIQLDTADVDQFLVKKIERKLA